MSNEEWNFLQPVFSSEEVIKFRKKLNKVIIGYGGKLEPSQLKIIKQAGWIAVPAESGDHFCEEDRDKLLQAILERQNREVIAVTFEELNNFPTAFIVPATAEAIEEFARKCGHFWFALYAGEPDWVIVCTKLDYLVITSEPSFVSQFLGCEIDEGFASFYEFASSYSETDSIRKYLLLAYEQLWHNYPQIKPGEIIELLPGQ